MPILVLFSFVASASLRSGQLFRLFRVALSIPVMRKKERNLTEDDFAHAAAALAARRADFLLEWKSAPHNQKDLSVSQVGLL